MLSPWLAWFVLNNQFYFKSAFPILMCVCRGLLFKNF